MTIERVAGQEIVFAAVSAPHRFTQSVHGAQVKDEHGLVGEDLTAEPTHHLQTDTKHTNQNCANQNCEAEQETAAGKYDK